MSEELGCKLSTDAVEQSIGQRKRSDFKILLSRTSLFVRGALAIIGVLFSVASYRSFALDTNQTQITWVLRSLKAVGPSLIYCAWH